MFEAYSVGIRLQLLDSVSAGLTGLASHFMAFNRHVGTSQKQLAGLEGQLQRLKLMGMAGGVAAGLGLAGLAMLKGPIDEARKWSQEAAKFASLGFGDEVNTQAQQFARGMQTVGTSARDNLSLLGDAMAVFKNLGNAQMAAPILARMKYANDVMFGSGSAGSDERQMMDTLKAIEMRRGLSSPMEFARQANFIQQAIAGSRGRVAGSQWLQLLKTGGVAVSRMGDKDFYLGLEPILQEFGGQRLGTSLMSVYQNLVQARGSLMSQQELYRLGLLDPSKVQFNALGQLKHALPGAFRGSGIFETQGPLALMSQVLIPAFARHGITTEPQIIDELGRLLSNRTASNVLTRVYQQRASISMQSAANAHALNVDQLSAAAANTPDGKWLAMTAQYRNLLLELGTAVLPIAIKGVSGLTGVLHTAVGIAREFPRLTSGLTIAFGALSSLVAVGGVITLATAGFKALGLTMAAVRLGEMGTMLIGALTPLGWAVGAIAAIGAASAGMYEIYKHREAIEGWFTRVFHLPTQATPENGWGGGHLGWGGRSTVNHVQVHVDKKKIIDIIAPGIMQHQVRAMSAPQTGITGFSSAMTPMPAGGVR